jgi:hypothetical protein
MTARHKIGRRLRTDWFRVLADLLYAGVTLSEVSRQINVPKSTIRGWSSGSEPTHDDGYALLELWIAKTGQSFAQRPMMQKGGIPLTRA